MASAVDRVPGVTTRAKYTSVTGWPSLTETAATKRSSRNSIWAISACHTVEEFLYFAAAICGLALLLANSVSSAQPGGQRSTTNASGTLAGTLQPHQHQLAAFQQTSDFVCPSVPRIWRSMFSALLAGAGVYSGYPVLSRRSHIGLSRCWSPRQYRHLVRIEFARLFTVCRAKFFIGQEVCACQVPGKFANDALSYNLCRQRL